MNESRKEKILSNLKQAKETGQLKTESIRDIVRTAVSESVLEIKEGRAEISSLVQEAIAAVVEIFQDKEGEIKEQVLSLIHISEPTRPLYISYAVFCLKKKKNK